MLFSHDAVLMWGNIPPFGSEADEAARCLCQLAVTYSGLPLRDTADMANAGAQAQGGFVERNWAYYAPPVNPNPTSPAAMALRDAVN